MTQRRLPARLGYRGLASTLLSATALVAAAGLSTILFLPTVATAQDLTSGTLEGRITDADGKPISGATVTVRSNSQGFTRTFTTDETGTFRLTQTPVGSYTVSATAPGFDPLTDSNVGVNLGAVAHYEFPMLAPGSVSELVVAGTRRNPSVDFDAVTTGLVVDVQEVASRLPISRDIQGVLSLAPQVTISKAFSSTQLSTRPDNPTGDAVIAGSSAAENIYYINGMNITNFRNFLGGSTVPFEFYDQVQVKTGGYSAEYGRSTGGAIIAVTRSGSNTFHGGINGYWTPQQWRVKSPNTATISKNVGTVASPSYNNTYNLGLDDQNVSYEGNIWLSGPIWKDHLFFFGFYNPRHFENVTGTSSSISSTPNAFTNSRPDVYDIVTRDKPFYGGKIDLNITDSQRLSFTMFKDNENSVDKNFIDTGTSYTVSSTNNYSGGKNEIVNYTGRFTDWFTLSALYGESHFNQSSIGELDSQAAVFSETAGALVRGNPNLLIAAGNDSRKNYRLDADIYARVFGDHHVRIGYDKEDLLSTQAQSYSGGVYYRYYPTGTNCGSSGTTSTAAAGCVRVRRLQNIGSFGIVQQGLYLQDAWDVTDRLQLQVGVRSEDFNNKNAGGQSFVHSKKQIAPRLGATYDVFGDRSTKVSAFFGRYYLPIAGNTNIRGSGGETFQEDFYLYSTRDATTLVPTLATKLIHRCLEGTDTGTACTPQYPAPETLRSGNLKPQYQDEYLAGIEHTFKNGWRASANLIYRDLKSVLEDANLDNAKGAAAGRSPYCVYANISVANCGSFGNSGYVLINPGRDVVLQLNDTWGALTGQTVTIPAAVTGLPKASRKYEALELKLSRPWDGKWAFDGSYVLSRSRGNYEGGVKSDTTQSDTGGTTDFDQPGWMDGSKGLLPNDHTHQLKLFGAYAITESLRVGANVEILSPRHYGCIGYFPPDPSPVPRADSTTLAAWYCNGVLTPRASQFTGDWIKTVNLNLNYDLPVKIGRGKVQLRADVFNLFDTKDALINNEFGETGGFGTRNFAYGTPALYQDPRTVRLGVNYSF